MSSRDVSLSGSVFSASGFDASAEGLTDAKLNEEVPPMTVLKKEKEETTVGVATDVSDKEDSFFDDSIEGDADLSFVVDYCGRFQKVKQGNVFKFDGLTSEEWAKIRVSQKICAGTTLDKQDTYKIATKILLNALNRTIFSVFCMAK